jgi:hypothetical protein
LASLKFVSQFVVVNRKNHIVMTDFILPHPRPLSCRRGVSWELLYF